MAHYYRIGSDAVDFDTSWNLEFANLVPFPVHKRAIHTFQRVIFFIFVVGIEDGFLCVYFFEKKKRILRNKFFSFFFKFVEVIAKK